MTQSLSIMLVHIVFSTKGRYPFLTDKNIRDELFRYMASLIFEHNSIPIIINGVEDHIHILSVLSKNVTLSSLIGDIKRSSSFWIKSKGDQYKKFYWQRGYGAFSVSSREKQRVFQYIQNQEIHHKKNKDFKKELLQLLDNNQVTYDERYLWE